MLAKRGCLPNGLVSVYYNSRLGFIGCVGEGGGFVCDDAFEGVVRRWIWDCGWDGGGDCERFWVASMVEFRGNELLNIQRYSSWFEDHCTC